MKLGILLETNEPEKAWNGVRFANTALKQGHEVRLFLMSAGVEAVEIAGEPYDVRKQLDDYEAQGGTLLACGTCLKSRKLDEAGVCPVSTMCDCLDMVTWADKVITF